MFFISVVEASRLYSVREAAKASALGFDDARSEYKWVKPINNRNGFFRFFVKIPNDQKHEKRNLEIHHSDDNRHTDGYRNQPGSNQLHGASLIDN